MVLKLVTAFRIVLPTVGLPRGMTAVRFLLGAEYVLVEGRQVFTGVEASPTNGDGVPTVSWPTATDVDLTKLVKNPRITVLMGVTSGKITTDMHKDRATAVTTWLSALLDEARTRGLV